MENTGAILDAPNSLVPSISGGAVPDDSQDFLFFWRVKAGWFRLPPVLDSDLSPDVSMSSFDFDFMVAISDSICYNLASSAET